MEKSSEIKKSLPFLFRFLRVVVVLVVAVALAKLFIFLKEKPEKKEIVKTPPRVKVMVATPVSTVMTIDAHGTVKPRKLVKIAVEVPGRIQYMHPSFVEGGRVDKDEVLVEIDRRSYALDRQAGQVRIRQAEADIESLRQEIDNLEKDVLLSRANATLAKKELERITALSRHQFASKNSLDKAEQQYLQAEIQLQAIHNRLLLTDALMEQKKAGLAMARVEFEKTDLALKKTRIISGFDGFVLDKFVEQGEYVNPGQALGSIYQRDRLDVDVSIPLEKMKWIDSFFRNGKTPDARVMVANPAGMASGVWNARVVRLKAKIDEKTRTLPMTLEILNPDVKIKNGFDLKPGTFVKCSLIGETYENVFVLPRHLLKQGNILFTVNDNHLTMKQVTVLRLFEEDIYINGGLNPGDQIISSPLPGAFEGMEVTIKQNGT